MNKMLIISSFIAVLCLSLIVIDTEKEGKEQSPVAELRRQLKLDVPSLSSWRKSGNDISKLSLYIDGVAFNGLDPLLIGNGTLGFNLRLNAQNKDAWATLLSMKGDRPFGRRVHVAIRSDRGDLVQGPYTFKLISINQRWFWVFIVTFVIAILLFWWCARESDIIRDAGPQPGGVDKKGKPNRKPYSLARTQMALWFFAIIIGYVFLWMVTSDISGPSAAILGLMGISAATGLGAAVVDSSKQSEQENQHRILLDKKKATEDEAGKISSEIDSIKVAINAIPPPSNLAEQTAALAVKQAELAAKTKDIDQVVQDLQTVEVASKPAVSKNFICDVLSDDDGISFHRLQMFAWTLVLLLIFVSKVYDTLGMPSFDGTLLGLMGISGGTYIGFKLPDQQG